MQNTLELHLSKTTLWLYATICSANHAACVGAAPSQPQPEEDSVVQTHLFFPL